MAPGDLIAVSICKDSALRRDALRANPIPPTHATAIPRLHLVAAESGELLTD
jgi:hypothetical protein